MPEVKPKKCTICNLTVNTLGSYAQVALGKHAHLKCVQEAAYEKGWQEGRDKLIAEMREQREREELARKNREAQMLADAELRKAEEDRERRESEKQRLANLRYRVDQLPRCPGCGKRINVTKPHREPMAIEEVREVEPDAVEPSPGYDAGGRCRNCAEVERLARNAARNPQAAAPAKAPEDKKPEDKKDRFELVEVD